MCGIGQILAGGAIVVSGVVLELATFGGYTFALGFHEAVGLGLMASGGAMATYHAQDIKLPNVSWKNNGVYVPVRKEATKKQPRFNGKDLGSDPTKPPGEGFEWRGKGSPESGKGNWLNPSTGEKLHPDLSHPEPKGPHWGYKDAGGTTYDLYPNGSWQ